MAGVDARDGLTAAEQGLNADMRGAAGEIASLLAAGSVPTPEELAEEGTAALCQGCDKQGRGDHIWSLGNSRRRICRLARQDGLGRDCRLASPAHGDGRRGYGRGEEGASSVWLNLSTDAGVSGLSTEALVASGWKEIVIVMMHR
jgi:hypothetical protein